MSVGFYAAMIEFRTKGLSIREYWFDEPWSSNDSDILLFYHSSGPVPSSRHTPVYSLALDLSRSEEEIWAGFGSSTRNQINRAIRDGVTHEVLSRPTEADIETFLTFYESFTSERQLGKTSDFWFRKYAEQGLVVITYAQQGDGTPLAWHTYYYKAPWVRQLHSVSFFSKTAEKETRNLIARANRYLHWADLKEFRSRGILHFDFGGWYAGGTDPKLLQVNAFKEEFGGERIQRFHSTLGTSLKGKIFLTARDHLRGADSTLHHV